jgi:ferredoxin-thioredoxin reductase catalytic chain
VAVDVGQGRGQPPEKNWIEVRETTSEDEILALAERYSRENGWMLNPDRKTLTAVIQGLTRNEERFGERYCLCRLRSGDEGKDRAIICPCVYHRDEIEKDGHCHCQLYYRKDVAGPEALGDMRNYHGD